MDPTLVVKALTELAPTRIEQRGFIIPGVGRCIVSTRVGVEVLQHFGIAAEAIPVRVAAANAIFIRYRTALNRGTLSPEEIKKRGARLIITDDECLEDHGPLSWPGHLVVGLPATNQIIDLDVSQFSRPGIIVPRAVSVWVKPQWWKGDMESTYPLKEGGLITYLRLRKFTPWQDTKDWSDTLRWKPIVRKTIKDIEERCARAEISDRSEGSMDVSGEGTPDH